MMKSYPSYKDSGVEWIGEIPNHWEVTKLKYTDKIEMGQSPSSDDYNDEHIGLPFLQGNADFTKISPQPRIWCNSANKIANLNDILISVRAPIGAVNISDQDYGIGRGLCALKSRESNPKFLYYLSLTLHDELNSIGTGSTYLAISTDDIKNIFIPFVKDKFEQQQIVSFLDQKTQQIDDLIQKTEQKIELLKEKRTSLINHCVTKGLDPNVEMKDSGVEWIGEIPKNWEITKIKHELKNLDRFRVPISSEIRGQMTNKVYDYYGASGVIDKVEDYIFDEPLILLGEDGANLLSRSTPLAFIAKGKYWVNNHAHILKPINGNINYLVNLLETIDYSIYVTGAAQPKLTSENLMNIKIFIPSNEEQNQIVSYLNDRCHELNTLIEKESKRTKLLKEYRQSLISEIVTGKIDVRDEVVV